MLNAQGEYVLFTDMDQATPIEEINKLLPFVEKFDMLSAAAVRKEKARRGRGF